MTRRGWALLGLGLLVGVLPASAAADRRALSLDVGGGVALQSVTTPYAESSPAVFGVDPTLQLGARYALTNLLELTLEGWFELPATYYHSGATVAQDGKSYTGTLKHQSHRYGAVLGARVVFGYTWRPFVGLEVGWAHRSFDNLQHIDDSDPAYPQDYYLRLPGLTRDNVVGAATVGVQYVGDHLTVSLAPRFDFMFGPDATWVFSIPLTVGWSFYL